MKDTIDECDHCLLKGDYYKCINTPCSKHESWFAQEQHRQIKRLKEILSDVQRNRAIERYKRK